MRQLLTGGDSLRNLSKVESMHLKRFNYILIEASAAVRIADASKHLNVNTCNDHNCEVIRDSRLKPRWCD